MTHPLQFFSYQYFPSIIAIISFSISIYLLLTLYAKKEVTKGQNFQLNLWKIRLSMFAHVIIIKKDIPFK